MTANSAEGQYLPSFLSRIRINRGLAFGVIIITALLAFEIFNYSTTDFALTDLLGELKFMGIRWATILSIAFCGIDFAGIARLFTPEEGANEPNEVWYLFGAWLLAATMNAMLTWWGVSLAVLNHDTLGNAVIGRETLLRAVPVFVAVLVWLIRVLIIGTFSAAGDRLFTQADQRSPSRLRVTPRVSGSTNVRSIPGRTQAPRPASLSAPRAAAPKSSAQPVETGFTRPEPTYHSLSMSGTNRPQSDTTHNPNGRPAYGKPNNQTRG
jgi:hypothetical protein